MAGQLGAWASLQSTPMEDEGDLDRRMARFTAQYDGKPVPRPPHWSGFRVTPHMIEFWQEGQARLHRRDRYDRAGDAWLRRRLYP